MKKFFIPHSKPTLAKEEKEALLKTADSGFLARGYLTAEFENKLAQYIGNKYAFATNSGTSALHLSLLALNVGSGDEVIIPSYVCTTLYSSVLFTGAVPVVADVNYGDGNINIESIKKAISNKTKAIIVPHIFGSPAEIDSIVNLAVPVIEDCAHSIGAEYKGKKVGSFGALSIFSFYPTKMITTGGGGAVITNNEKFINFVKDIGDYYYKNSPGFRYNYTMHDLNACLGLVQLEKLPSFIEKRKKIAKIYNKFFSNFDLEIPAQPKHIDNVYYRYLIKFPNNIKSSEIMDKLKSYGIKSSTNDYAIHRIYSLAKELYPNTESLIEQGLSIPLYPSLTDNEIQYILECCDKCLREILKI